MMSNAVMLWCNAMHALLCCVKVTWYTHTHTRTLILIFLFLFQVGWDTKPEDDHSAKLLRSSVISLLDNFACDDEVVLKEVKRRFEGHFTEPSLLPSEYKVRTCVRVYFE